MPHLVLDHLLTHDPWEAYFKAQPEWRVKKQSSLIWGEVKNALARQIHELSAYCNLVIITAHVRQAYDDGEPVPQMKEAKFCDRVWQTLDLVGYLVRDDGQGAPKALLAPPYGKAALPTLPELLSRLSRAQVSEQGVTEYKLPSDQHHHGFDSQGATEAYGCGAPSHRGRIAQREHPLSPNTA